MFFLVYNNCVPKAEVITKLPRKLQMYNFTPGKVRIYYPKLPLALPESDDCVLLRRVLVPFAKDVSSLNFFFLNEY